MMNSFSSDICSTAQRWSVLSSLETSLHDCEVSPLDT